MNETQLIDFLEKGEKHFSKKSRDVGTMWIDDMLEYSSAFSIVKCFVLGVSPNSEKFFAEEFNEKVKGEPLENKR